MARKVKLAEYQLQKRQSFLRVNDLSILDLLQTIDLKTKLENSLAF